MRGNKKEYKIQPLEQLPWKTENSNFLKNNKLEEEDHTVR